ncbi:Protein kinase, putative [Hondaea fermentalgiana]|uniref:Protein kinase, putative n=1 Tax=Hondaea fermentalgiana TaxID=2315210 RepID=A0A2R5GAB2_9STRA|nr:Protein kinase, putative [Hondaea fermentalgiana]|eukprot:GBG27942.1 Protein kinase, putative [Hondaea fermentalgiana]
MGSAAVKLALSDVARPALSDAAMPVPSNALKPAPSDALKLVPSRAPAVQNAAKVEIEAYFSKDTDSNVWRMQTSEKFNRSLSSDRIDSNGCCTLFLGEVEHTGETVALKLYADTPRGSRDRKNELKILRVIASAPDACEFIITPKIKVQEPFIGLEFCAGSDLTRYLRRGLPVLPELQRLGREIALGLGFLHICNIVHEDIKPENIGLTADNHVRIIDFGLSIFLDSPTITNPAASALDSELAQSRIRCRHGTAPYTSPEKLLGELHGFEVDWWSFGVVFYEMAYGALPWYSRDRLEVSEKICSHPLSIPSQRASSPSCSLIRDAEKPLQNVQMEFNHKQNLPFMVQVHAPTSKSAREVAARLNAEVEARREQKEEQLKAFQAKTQRRIAAYNQSRRARLAQDQNPAEDGSELDGASESPTSGNSERPGKILAGDLALDESKHREVDEFSELSRSLAESRSQTAAARQSLLAYTRGRRSFQIITQAGASSPHSQGLGNNSFGFGVGTSEPARPPAATRRPDTAEANLDSSFQGLDTLESKKRIAERQRLVRQKEMAFSRLLARRRRAVLEHKRKVKDEQERLFQARCEREKLDRIARTEAKLADSGISETSKARAGSGAAPASPTSSQASKKRRDKEESLRYIAALQRRLETVAEHSKGVKLPFLCSCAAARGSNGLSPQDGELTSAPWETCASNCRFHNNPQTYAKELVDLFRSLELL